MDERSVFSVSDLRRMLMRVIGVRAASDGVIGVDLSIVRQLATSLSGFSVAEVSIHPDAIAELMANMAMLVNGEVGAIRYVGENALDVDALTRQIRSDFAIECVIFFVRSCGYRLYIDPRSRDKLTLALLMSDWDLVARIFEKSISPAAVGEGRSDLLYDTAGYSNSQHQRASHSYDRQLSGESYSNLVSVADDQQWSAADVLMLIEEFLNPDLRPDLVHHSQVVSGEEWHDLYDWLHREGRYL